MKRYLCIALAACHLLWLSGPSFAQLRPAPATIVFVKGKAEVQRSGERAWRPAELQMAVSPGDKLSTEAGAELEIRLDDGSVLKLKDKSLLELDAMEKKVKPLTTITSLKLGLGKLLGCVRKLSSRESKFEVTTPTAVAGVRGTVFAVFAEGDSTELDVLKGQVAVAGQLGSEKLVGEKQSTVVAKRDSARTPVPMTAAKIAFMTAWAGAALKLGSMGAAGAKAWYASTPALVGGGVVAAAAVAVVIIAAGGGNEGTPPGGGPGGGPTITNPPILPPPPP
jgi:hypothetical protein